MLATFRAAVASHGHPRIHADRQRHGLHHPARRRPRRPQRLRAELRRLDIIQKNSRPNHPTTCGKVERFQQTLKKWLRAQPAQPATIAELQALLDVFVDDYNHHGPTAPCPTAPPRPPPTSPAQSHPAATGPPTPTTASATTASTSRHRHPARRRPPPPHRHRPNPRRTHVILLVHDLDIRVVNAATGELLRDLTLDPTRDYQPTGTPPGPQNEDTGPNEGSTVPDVLRHHMERATGFEPAVPAWEADVLPLNYARASRWEACPAPDEHRQRTGFAASRPSRPLHDRAGQCPGPDRLGLGR